jgi:hypothetical protein
MNSRFRNQFIENNLKFSTPYSGHNSTSICECEFHRLEYLAWFPTSKSVGSLRSPNLGILVQFLKKQTDSAIHFLCDNVEIFVRIHKITQKFQHKLTQNGQKQHKNVVVITQKSVTDKAHKIIVRITQKKIKCTHFSTERISSSARC